MTSVIYIDPEQDATWHKFNWQPLASVSKAIDEAQQVLLSPFFKAEAAHTGAMVALYPSPAVAKKLALPGGEPASELHLTLAFLGEAADVDGPAVIAAVRRVCARAGALSGTFSGIGRFTIPDGDAFYASADVPGLPAFREAVVAALDAIKAPVATNHGFTPHCTLAYLDAEDEPPIDRLDPVPVTFDSVWVVLAGDRTEIPLAGVTKAGPEASPSLVKAGPEDEERDDHGRWTTGGFHGTSVEAAKAILREGIRGSKARTNWDASKQGLVYLSPDKEIADTFGSMLADVNGDKQYAIVRIEIPSGMASSLKEDQEFLDESISGLAYTYNHDIPASLIKGYDVYDAMTGERVSRIVRKATAAPGVLYAPVSLAKLQAMLGEPVRLDKEKK